MTQPTKTAIKRWILSSIVSFLTGFFLILLTEIDGITLETVRDGSYAGTVFLAFRAGIKAVMELFLMTFNK
jgi:hypothetical protein